MTPDLRLHSLRGPVKMINPSVPLIEKRMMSRESLPLPKQTLSLNPGGLSDFAGLQPNPYKSPVMSPTLKTHSEGLPASVTGIDGHEFQKLSAFLEPSTDVLVLDVRPYNTYFSSHLRSSVNICVPTTLLKRPKYDLTHVINASNLTPALKEAILNETRRMKVLLYDNNSTDKHLSFQIYHTMLKFIAHDRFSVYYVRGGFEAVDSSLTDASQALPMRLPVSLNSTDFEKSDSLASESPTSQQKIANTDGMPFLSGFSLPSATSADSKLLMSIKKSLPKLDTITAYNYKFRFPKDFERKKSRLPRWLSFFADVYGKEDSLRLIVERFNDMFNRLEKSEQVRLRMAISNIDKDSELCRKLDKNLHETEGYGTPLTLCPCCDKIEYTIPKGVEYGYKNRYNNIWPYEHSRVHLIPSPSCTHRNNSDDYFNANYISYQRLSKRRYIATQNPLDSTKDDFWSTVWHNGVKAIVCLAAPPVFGQLAYYEHDLLSEKGVLAVKIKSCEQMSSFTLRKITLTKQGKSQTVFHFAYHQWPDFGMPEDLKSVFDLIKIKNEKLSILDAREALEKSNAWDVLVHCSAGCGRTGCYITMDMVLDSFQNPNTLKDHYDPWGEQDLVYKSIQFQRQQRISMVQNLDQFIFCYESILNYIVSHLIE